MERAKFGSEMFVYLKRDRLLPARLDVSIRAACIGRPRLGSRVESLAPSSCLKHKTRQGSNNFYCGWNITTNAVTSQKGSAAPKLANCSRYASCLFFPLPFVC